jgi:hypothetical protein
VKSRPEGEWRLVISIHGKEDLLSTKASNLKKPQAEGVYRADEIRKLFVDDKQFTDWRKDHGPTWTTLNACQVHMQFESVIIEAFNKAKTSQHAQGLGTACRPDTVVLQYHRSGHKTPVTTRSQWGALSMSEKKAFERMLSELNTKFGYFGGPPVPETHLLHYYFDEPPKGGWPVITVSLNRHDTGISFYNRATNTRFLTSECKEHLGPLPPHIPKPPPDTRKMDHF